MGSFEQHELGNLSEFNCVDEFSNKIRNMALFSFSMKCTPNAEEEREEKR